MYIYGSTHKIQRRVLVPLDTEMQKVVSKAPDIKA